MSQVLSKSGFDPRTGEEVERQKPRKRVLRALDKERKMKIESKMCEKHMQRRLLRRREAEAGL